MLLGLGIDIKHLRDGSRIGTLDRRIHGTVEGPGKFGLLKGRAQRNGCRV